MKPIGKPRFAARALASLVATLLHALPAAGLPLITQVVETGGWNELTDTITARFTGQTFTNGIPGEYFHPYTVPTFGEEAPCYVDRVHEYNGATAAGIPPYLAGGEYILIGNDNRDRPALALDVTVSAPVTVYLLIDNRLTDSNSSNPPENGSPLASWTRMKWVGTDGFAAVKTGANRAGDANLPDEVGIDESGDGTGPGVSIQNWYSVYSRTVPAGTFRLKEGNQPGQTIYGVVITDARHQGLTWVSPAPGTVLRVGQAYPLAATASSGLPVTYRVESGSATIAGGNVTPTAPGTLVLAADQAGNGTYAPATIRRLFNRPTATLSPVAQWPGYARGDARAVAVSGSHAYLAASYGGLVVFDIADPDHPTRVFGRPPIGESSGIAVVGNRLYLVDTSGALEIFDLTTPGNPLRLGIDQRPASYLGIALDGNRAYLANGGAGLQIFDVSNPAAPAWLGSLDTPGHTWNVAVAGGRAYLADDAAGIQIVDVANPAQPVLLGTYDTPGVARAVLVSGTRAYVADTDAGLHVLDVSNPAAPTLLGSIGTGGSVADLALVGTLLHVANGYSGIRVVDVANPAAPTLVGNGLDTPGWAARLTLSGSLALVADSDGGLRVVEVSQPAGLVARGAGEPSGTSYNVAVEGNLGCLADGGAGLQVFDLSQPLQPVHRATFDTPGSAENVTLVGTRAYVADGWEGLRIVDLSQPAQPVNLGQATMAAHAVHTALAGNLAYVAGHGAGLVVVDVGTPANPKVEAILPTAGQARAVALAGTWAFLANGPAGLTVVDISQPTAPVLQTSLATGSYATAIAVRNSIAYVADQGYGVQIFDVATPTAPRWLGGFDTPGNAQRISLADHLILVADESSLQVLDVVDPTQPVLLGSYDTPGRALGAQLANGVAYVADHSRGLQALSARLGIPQTIAFYPPPSLAPGAPAVTLAATAGSGLPVSLVVESGPGTLNGNQLTTTGPGTVILRADQAGNAQFLPATTRRSLAADTLVLLPGNLKFEVWNGLSPSDNRLDFTLLADPRYPALPDFTSYTWSFSSQNLYPDNRHDGYGGRLSGFVSPPVTGDYRFFLHSDDASRLFVSTDDQAANLRLVAEETACCNGFTEPYSPRTSAPIPLVAGQRYYVEGIWKEGGGGDYLRVAWRREGDPTPASQLLPIPASALGTLAPAPTHGAPEVTIPDPAGNLAGDTSRTFVDLVQVALQATPERYRLEATTVAPFPSSADLTADQRLDIIWFVDRDRDGWTGQSPDGNDYNIHLWLDRGGWHWEWYTVSETAYIDDFTRRPEDFRIEVDGNRAALSFPASYLPRATFDLWATSGTFNSPNWPPSTSNPGTARATFEPDSDLPLVWLATEDLQIFSESDPPTLLESGGRVARIRLGRSGDLAAPLDVTLDWTGAAARGLDFEAPATVAFAPGEEYAPVELRPRDDGLDEGPEETSVAIAPQAAYRILDPSTARFRIVDDENPAGAVVRRTYRNANEPYGQLTNLLNDPDWPANPDMVDLLPGLESQGPWVLHGDTLAGFLLPPASGDYRFFLASLNESELWLSTDVQPANLRRIAREPQSSGRRDWSVRSNGEKGSDPIPLLAGQRYYFEVRHQRGGYSHVGVNWQLPGSPAPVNGAPPIGGEHLALRLEDLDAPATPSLWTRWPAAHGGTDHWYARQSRPLNWTEAEGAARTLPGTHLATLLSRPESEFLQTAFGSHLAWIGLTDYGTEGSFRWVTGEPVSFTDWSQWQPTLGSWAAPFVYLDPANANRWANAFHILQNAGLSSFLERNTPPPDAPGRVRILRGPEFARVAAGAPARLESLVEGGTPAYQWLRAGQPIPNANGPDHDLAAASPADAGSYQLRVTAGSESALTLPARLFVQTAPDLVHAGPLVTDALGNLTGDLARTFCDLTAVSLRLSPERYLVDFEVAGPLPTPAQMGAGQRLDFLLYIDADRNGTGTQPGGIGGDDYDLVVSLAASGWSWAWNKVSNLSTSDGVSIRNQDILVEATGNRVTFSFPVRYLPTPHFDVWARATTASSANWPPITENGFTSRGTFDRREFDASGGGASFPTGDLAEANAAAWGAAASDSAATQIVDDPVRRAEGAAAVRLDTAGGFDVYAFYPRTRDAHWDLRWALALELWVHPDTQVGFQINAPVIRLVSAAGSRDYTPNANLLDQARNRWSHLVVPLSGDSTWTRTDSGTFDPADVLALEIHADVWDYGFQLSLDGVRFLESYAPPAHDAFARRQLLEAGTPVVADNRFATQEINEPVHGEGAGYAHTLWWTWTAPRSGPVLITTTGSGLNPVLAVYTGSTLANLHRVLEVNDAVQLNVAEFTFHAQAGTEYQIAADGAWGATGPLQLRLDLTDPATSDWLYATDFDAFPFGVDRVPGTDGWIGVNATGVNEVLDDPTTWNRGIRLGGGGAARPGPTPQLYRPLDFDPVAAGRPHVRFTVECALTDPGAGPRDAYGFAVLNRAGARLAGLRFDHATGRILRDAGVSANAVDTGIGFSPGTQQSLELTIDFAANRWSGRYGSQVLFEAQTFHAGAALPDLGGFAAEWTLADPGHPGSSRLVLDHYTVTASAQPGLVRGGLRREIYFGIPSEEVSVLRNAPRFPHEPHVSDRVARLEAPWGQDVYGQRLSGYLTPPVTGEYRFFLASDDTAELYVSTDDSPAHLRLLARETSWRAARQWTLGTPDGTVSAPIPLEAGRNYYLQVLSKEGGGGDNLAVAWRPPGPHGVQFLQLPVPGEYLSYRTDGPEVTGPPIILVPPAPVTAREGQEAVFSVQAGGTGPLRYQWRRNQVDLPGETSRILRIPHLGATLAGEYSVVVANDLASLESTPVPLVVVADLAASQPSSWPPFTQGPLFETQLVGNHLFGALGLGGIGVYDVSNPANPTQVAGLQLDAYSRSLARHGSRLIVAAGGAGVVALDLSNPLQPQPAWTLGGFYAVDVEVRGDYAYVAAGWDGLEILDLTNPSTPLRIGQYDSPGYAEAVDVVGGRAYLADGSSGLSIVDVSNPAAPALLGSYDTPGYAMVVRVRNGYAYLGHAGFRILILDIGVPTDPIEAGTLEMPSEAQGLAFGGDRLLVARGGNGIGVYQLDDPAQPSPEALLLTGGFATSLHVDGSVVYVGNQADGLSIHNLDLLPVTTRVGASPTATRYPDVDVSGNHAFVAAGNNGLTVFDLTAAPPISSPVASLDDSLDTRAIQVVGTIAYVTDGPTGSLYLYDISDPLAPKRLSSTALTGWAGNLFAAPPLVLVPTHAERLYLVDCSDPRSPVRRGELALAGAALSAGLDSTGRYAYVGTSGRGLFVVDVANPDAPVVVRNLAAPGALWNLLVDGGRLYTANGGDEVHIYSLADPSAPVLLGRSTGGVNPADLRLQGHVLLVASYNDSLIGLDIRNPALPARILEQRLDGTAPRSLDVRGDHVVIAQDTRGLTLLTIPGLAPTPPAITQPPSPAIVSPGALARFEVRATGNLPLGYRWTHDGVPVANGPRVAGANSAVLTIFAVQPGDVGTYQVEVTNPYGSPVTASATLSMIDSQGPYVVAFSPTRRGNQPVDQARVQFNEPIEVATLVPAAVTLTGPGGTVPTGSISIQSIAPHDGTAFALYFPAQNAEGNYTLGLAPTIQDPSGNPLARQRLVADDAFTTGPQGWVLNFDAHWLPTGALQLTDQTLWTRGTAFLRDPLPPGPFVAELDFEIPAGGETGDADGPGADGFVFVVGDRIDERPDICCNQLGYVGYPGRSFAVEFDTWNGGPEDLPTDHLSINWNGTFSLVREAAPRRFIGTGPWHASIRFDGLTRLTVDLEAADGTLRHLEADLPADSIPTDSFYFGFSGATGGGWSEQNLDRLTISRFPAAGDPAGFQATFAIDRTGPALAVPNAGNLSGAPLATLDLDSDSPLNPASFDPADVTVVGAAVPVTAALSAVTPTRLRVTFTPPIPPGAFTVKVGPGIEDEAGNPLDQDRDGTPGEAVDDVVAVAPANRPPSIAPPAAFWAWRGQTVPVAGLRIADPDAGAHPLTLGLTCLLGHGTLAVNTSVAGGLIPAQVQNNGSAALTITAPLAALNATFAHPAGLTFTAEANYVGGEELRLVADDNGFTGNGGALQASVTVLIDVRELDFTPPTLLLAVPRFAENLVALRFDDLLGAATALDPNRYRVNGALPSSVVFHEDEQGVDLHVPSLPPPFARIEVEGVRDLAGNPLPEAVRRHLTLRFAEDFEGLPLGPNFEETLAAAQAWTHTPPTGWSIDNSEFVATRIDPNSNPPNPDANQDGYADSDGVTEWAGWSFANRDWWTQVAPSQRRSEFTFAQGTVAVADSDEWTDSPHPPSLFRSHLLTRSWPIAGRAPNTLQLSFHSSWRPEGFDDFAPLFPVGPNGAALNNQTAVISASFDGAPPVEILRWDSEFGSRTYHDHRPNERVLLPVHNPAGAQNLVLTFSYLDAANDWWWAIDNLEISDSAPPAVIAGRHVFYNQSVFDGNSAAANAADDAAIAPDKAALRPGAKATFANYTTYQRGLNGLMIDIAGLPGIPTAADFVFRVGNNSTPASWPAAPAPASVTVRPGAGLGGSDRVTLVWGADAVKKKWLQVTVLATPNTGLAQPDVFYFGNAIGETGNSAADARVTAADALRVLNNLTASAALANRYDINRDGRVGAADRLTILANLSALDPLILLDLTAGGALQGAFPATRTPTIPALAVVATRASSEGLHLQWIGDGTPVTVWTTDDLGAADWEVLEEIRFPDTHTPGTPVEILVPIDPAGPARFYRLESGSAR